MQLSLSGTVNTGISLDLCCGLISVMVSEKCLNKMRCGTVGSSSSQRTALAGRWWWLYCTMH